jgi:hypothetical protein
MRARRHGTSSAAPAASSAHQCPCPTVGDEVGLPGTVVGRCPVADALAEDGAEAGAVVVATVGGVVLEWALAAVVAVAPGAGDALATPASGATDGCADCDARTGETEGCGAEKGTRLFGATGPPSKLQTTMSE